MSNLTTPPDRLTSTDILLASHILAIHHAPVPQAHVKELLQSEYSVLIKHAATVLELVVGRMGAAEGTASQPRAIPAVQRSTKSFEITSLLPVFT